MASREKLNSSRVGRKTKKMASSVEPAEPADALDEMRIIERFRRPFKPLRSSLLALESLKNQSGDTSELGSALSDHLMRLGDFIEGDEELRGDAEAWDFIGCFWPFHRGSSGPELRMLYESLKRG